MAESATADVVAELPPDVQARISFALRVGQLANVPNAAIQRAAYTAAAEVLTSRSIELDFAAPYADTLAYQRRDQAEAQRLHELASRLLSQREQVS